MGYGGLRDPQAPDPQSMPGAEGSDLDEVPIGGSNDTDRAMRTNSLEELWDVLTPGPVRDVVEDRLRRRFLTRSGRMPPRDRIALKEAVRRESIRLSEKGVSIPDWLIEHRMHKAALCIILEKKDEREEITYPEAIALVLKANGT